MHVGSERGANLRDDLRARAVVGLLQDPADGTDLGDVADQVRLGHGARNVDRPDVDVGPAAFLEDAVDAVPIRERELPRRVRIGARGCSAGAVPRRARPSS